MINSGRLHFVKAVTPGAELAEFALPPAFFERFLERVAIQAVQPVVESLGRTEMQEKAGILLKKDVAYCLRSGLRDFFANYAILHLTHFQSSAKTHLLHKAECLPANLAL